MKDFQKNFTDDQIGTNPYLFYLELFRDKRIKKAKDYAVARFSLFCVKQQHFKNTQVDKLIPPDSTLDLRYYEELVVPSETKAQKFSDYDRSLLAFEGYIEKWAQSAEFYQRVTLTNLKKITASSQTLIKLISSVTLNARDAHPEIKDPTLKQIYIDVNELEKFDPILRLWDSIVSKDLFNLRAGNVVLSTICNFFGLPFNCFEYYTDKTIEDVLFSLVRKDKTLAVVRADIPQKELKRLLSILCTHSFFPIDDYSIYDRLRESLIYKPDPETSEEPSETPTDKPEQEAP